MSNCIAIWQAHPVNDVSTSDLQLFQLIRPASLWKKKQQTEKINSKYLIAAEVETFVVGITSSL
jgi:hypothetical protein